MFFWIQYDMMGQISKETGIITMKNRQTLTGYLFATFTIIVWGSTFISSKTLLAVYTPAQIMLTRYASAEMVFTRRLHCAMACLAVGTPVLLLYHAEYEDISRFAPMDAMVRKQPVDDFLREVRQHGMPAPWRNPADVGAIQRLLLGALNDGMKQAESAALPLVSPEEGEFWRGERIRRMMKSAAGKIQRLENQHYDDLHQKFTQLILEEDVKSTLTELLTLPEVESALRAASLRMKLESLPSREQKALQAEHKRNLVDVDDLIRQAHGMLGQLGWPENDDE